MSIPFVDLKAQYKSIKDEIDSSIQNVINETAFIKGDYVKKFEEEYAEAYRVKHCISCANGTDAIYISLKALDIGIGDEVITVANSWISTSETITQAGAKPVFVDIEPNYYTIDVSKIEKKITKRTKAIIPVHLYGHPAQMDRILDICKSYNLFLIEDCAQAHFAEYKRKRVGTMGIAGTFSFYPGKNIGAYGDAGAIITNDDAFAKKSRIYANHGAVKKHFHEIEGINSRMDGIQAAVLSVKLRYILEWNKKRNINAGEYNVLFKGINDIVIPTVHPDAKHVYHLYVIRLNNRENLQKILKKEGISTAIHYPNPLPKLEAYEYMGHKEKDFPVSYSYSKKILSLPMYPELSSDKINFIANKIINNLD